MKHRKFVSSAHTTERQLTLHRPRHHSFANSSQRRFQLLFLLALFYLPAAQFFVVGVGQQAETVVAFEKTMAARSLADTACSNSNGGGASVTGDNTHCSKLGPSTSNLNVAVLCDGDSKDGEAVNPRSSCFHTLRADHVVTDCHTSVHCNPANVKLLSPTAPLPVCVHAALETSVMPECAPQHMGPERPVYSSTCDYTSAFQSGAMAKMDCDGGRQRACEEDEGQCDLGLDEALTNYLPHKQYHSDSICSRVVCRVL